MGPMCQNVVPAAEQNCTQATETVIELISVFDPKPAYGGASPALDRPTAALPREICDAMSAQDLISDAPGAIAVVLGPSGLEQLVSVTEPCTGSAW
jgi:hypothetical protein